MSTRPIRIIREYEWWGASIFSNWVFFNTSQSYFAGWITWHIMLGLQCCHCLLPKAKPGSLVCSVFFVIFSL
jgi:hypothetical protein